MEIIESTESSMDADVCGFLPCDSSKFCISLLAASDNKFGSLSLSEKQKKKKFLFFFDFDGVDVWLVWLLLRAQWCLVYSIRF